ncbi:MAG: hypothetical protein AAF191_20490 [Verrucomicrobiota bacterium]
MEWYLLADSQAAKVAADFYYWPLRYMAWFAWGFLFAGGALAVAWFFWQERHEKAVNLRKENQRLKRELGDLEKRLRRYS